MKDVYNEILKVKKVEYPKGKKARIEFLKNWQGQIVRHFKGDYYVVDSISLNCSNDDKIQVVYRPLYTSDITKFTRDIEDCISELDIQQQEEYQQEYKWQPVLIQSKRTLIPEF